MGEERIWGRTKTPGLRDLRKCRLGSIRNQGDVEQVTNHESLINTKHGILLDVLVRARRHDGLHHARAL